jgi:D-alanyl-lipoteichoic acid acyltransferase DltB (MBOAT superfamily)
MKLSSAARSIKHISFQQYLRLRLGPPGWARWYNFFIRPFGAASFAEFWRRWNPVYGYFLTYYVYRPLSRIVPRPAAMMATFVFCGFALHDLPAWVASRRVLPPGATITFVLFGLGAILSDALHMDLSAWPFAVRAGVNLAYVAGCVFLMLVVVLRLF